MTYYRILVLIFSLSAGLSISQVHASPRVTSYSFSSNQLEIPCIAVDGTIYRGLVDLRNGRFDINPARNPESSELCALYDFEKKQVYFPVIEADENDFWAVFRLETGRSSRFEIMNSGNAQPQDVSISHIDKTCFEALEDTTFGLSKTDSDYKRDFAFARRNRNNSFCQSLLSNAYEFGLGVRERHQLSFDLAESSAEAGNASGQVTLGNKFYSGSGVQQDFGYAYIFFTLAADQGYHVGQNNLGWLYENGQGVVQDYEQAFKWYMLAADQGYHFAQNNLGWLYEHELGVAQDYEQAFSWYQLAAVQGNVEAQFNLGLLYEHGQGVRADISQACYWYTLSATNRNARADEKIRELSCN